MFPLSLRLPDRKVLDHESEKEKKMSMKCLTSKVSFPNGKHWLVPGLVIECKMKNPMSWDNQLMIIWILHDTFRGLKS